MNRFLGLALFVLAFASTSLFGESHHDKAKKAVAEQDFIAALTHIREAVKAEPTDIPTLETAAVIYSELDIVDTAYRYAKQVYQDEPGNHDYARLFGRIALQAGKPIEAVDVLKKSNSKKEDVTTILILTDAYLAADSLTTAEILASTATKKFPKNAEAFLALGNLYFNYKPAPVYDLAVRNYEQAVGLNDKLTQAHFNLAQSYWKQANRESDKNLANELFTRSLMEWNKVGSLEPTNARAWFEQGKLFFLGNRPNDAVKVLNKYMALRPVGTGLPIASWYLGSSYFKLNQCDSAQKYLTDASARIDSVRAAASLQMARCYFLTKKYPESVKAYSASASTISTWEGLDAWFYGAALILNGDTTQALSTMAKAAEIDPSNCTFMFRYGTLLNSKKQYSASSKIYQKRLQTCNDSLNIRMLALIGNNFFADSTYDSAIVYFDRAVKSDSMQGFYVTRLAEAQILKGDTVSGKASFIRAYTLGSVPTATADNKKYASAAALRMAAMSFEMKTYTEVIDWAKKAVAIDPKSANSYVYLGVGYQGDGNKAEACKAYKDALAIDPQNKVAKDQIKSLGC